MNSFKTPLLKISYDEFIQRLRRGSISFRIKPDAQIYIPPSVLSEKGIVCESIIIFILILLIVLSFPILSLAWHQWNMMLGFLLFAIIYFNYYIWFKHIKNYPRLIKSIYPLVFTSLVASYYYSGLKSPLTICIIDLSIVCIYCLIRNYYHNKWLKEIVINYRDSFKDAVANNKIQISSKY
jgi:hypothetical protein